MTVIQDVKLLLSSQITSQLVTGLIEKGEAQLGLLFVCCKGQEPLEMVVLLVVKKWGWPRGCWIILAVASLQHTSTILANPIDLLKGLTRHCRTPEKLMSEVESLQSRNGAGLQGWPFVGY